MREEISCKEDSRAPHGFDRSSSHSEGRYVCECESWQPPEGERMDEDGFIDASPTPEEEAEASFYFFIKDVETYTKSGKWGPRIWKSLDEETKEIWRNMMRVELMGLTIAVREGSNGTRA
jgi:hypothetical protein